MRARLARRRRCGRAQPPFSAFGRLGGGYALWRINGLTVLFVRVLILLVESSGPTEVVIQSEVVFLRNISSRV